jgi:phosphoribosylformylglycinamidine (FGAM) synthase-like enzyme
MESGSTVLRFVRVYSNFVSSIEVEKQIQLYHRLSELQRKGIISSLSSVTERGIAGSLLNMSLWGSRGAQLRPGLSSIELFSASPGRLLVGVLPQDAKTFESELKGEQVLMVGTVKGDRLWGLKLSEMVKVMTDYEKDHIA